MASPQHPLYNKVTAAQAAEYDPTKGGFISSADLGEVPGYTKGLDQHGQTKYSLGESAGGAGGSLAGLPSGGGAKVVSPSSSSPALGMGGVGMSGGGGGGGEGAGSGDSLSGPTQFRNGIGTRILPMQSMTLAGLGWRGY